LCSKGPPVTVEPGAQSIRSEWGDDTICVFPVLRPSHHNNKGGKERKTKSKRRVEKKGPQPSFF
jgi:hypothetical protein